jgi:hypothetical protein
MHSLNSSSRIGHSVDMLSLSATLKKKGSPGVMQTESGCVLHWAESCPEEMQNSESRMMDSKRALMAHDLPHKRIRDQRIDPRASQIRDLRNESWRSNAP